MHRRSSVLVSVVCLILGLGPALLSGQARTWTDAATGLMWAGEDSSREQGRSWEEASKQPGLNWEQAAGYCGKSRLGGFPDWRLLTIDELKSIFDGSLKSEVDGYLVRGGIKLSGWTWSGSDGKNPGEKLKFSFFFAEDNKPVSVRADDATYTRALCVRGPVK